MPTTLVLDERGLAELADLPGITPVLHTLGTELSDDARTAEVLVAEGGSVDEMVALMGELPQLRLVQTQGAGIEQWQGRLPDGVALSNGRGAHGGSTAEWALAGLLATYRQLVGFSRTKTWDTHPTETLFGKKVLVIGAGDLADELKTRLDGCGASATLVGRTAREGIRAMDEVPELLGSHDAVVLMVPLTEATTGLVDAEFLSRMPERAVLVNAARGAVVDTDALLAELTSGRLRAVLDVTDPEPLPDGHPLWDAPNVLITPHVAGTTEGRDDRSWAVTRTQLGYVGRGEDPPNLMC